MHKRCRSAFAAVLLRKALSSVAAVGVAAALTMPAAPAAMAKTNLPKPFVSKSLDATLMPVTPQVRSAFRLGAKETGVLVVSADPRGVAAKSGIKAGDVISSVRGKKIANPAQLDATVLYWIKQGTTDFRFDGWRSGKDYSAAASITKALFDAVIDLASIGRWASVPTTQYFDYAVYYEEYDEVIVEEYEVYEEEIVELSEDSSFTEEVTEEYEEYSEEYSEESSESYEEESEETEEDDDGYDDDDADADEGDDEGYEDDEDADHGDDGYDDSEDEGDYEDEDDGGDYGDDDDGGDYDDGGDDGDYDDGGDEDY